MDLLHFSWNKIDIPVTEISACEADLLAYVKFIFLPDFSSLALQSTVVIAVYFLSEQINFVKNDKGDIISGSTSTINKVEDVWQFKKNVTSSDPSWLLTSICFNNQ
jgi:hypothetical protein